MRYCPNCGAQNEDSNKFCIYCGEAMPKIQKPVRKEQMSEETEQTFGREQEEERYASGYDYEERAYEERAYEERVYEDRARRENYSQPRERIVYTSARPRSIILSIILCFVTFGIYHLVWTAKITNDLNEMTEDRRSPSGGMVVFFSIITFGIYYLYWLFKMGNKCDDVAQSNGSRGVVTLLLGLFGLSILSMAVMQSTINHAIDQ